MANKVILDPQGAIIYLHCDQQLASRDALTHRRIDRYDFEYETMLAGEREALRLIIGKVLERKQARDFELKRFCLTTYAAIRSPTVCAPWSKATKRDITTMRSDVAALKNAGRAHQQSNDQPLWLKLTASPG